MLLHQSGHAPPQISMGQDRKSTDRYGREGCTWSGAVRCFGHHATCAVRSACDLELRQPSTSCGGCATGGIHHSPIETIRTCFTWHSNRDELADNHQKLVPASGSTDLRWECDEGFTAQKCLGGTLVSNSRVRVVQIDVVVPLAGVRQQPRNAEQPSVQSADAATVDAELRHDIHGCDAMQSLGGPREVLRALGVDVHQNVVRQRLEPGDGRCKRGRTICEIIRTPRVSASRRSATGLPIFAARPTCPLPCMDIRPECQASAGTTGVLESQPTSTKSREARGGPFPSRSSDDKSPARRHHLRPPVACQSWPMTCTYRLCRSVAATHWPTCAVQEQRRQVTCTHQHHPRPTGACQRRVSCTYRPCRSVSATLANMCRHRPKTDLHRPETAEIHRHQKTSAGCCRNCPPPSTVSMCLNRLTRAGSHRSCRHRAAGSCAVGHPRPSSAFASHSKRLSSRPSTLR